jgi:hypothetical protein
MTAYRKKVKMWGRIFSVFGNHRGKRRKMLEQCSKEGYNDGIKMMQRRRRSLWI